MTTRDKAWVITAKNDAALYWTGESAVLFSGDESKAIRFARRVDAERAITCMVKAQAVAVEHEFAPPDPNDQSLWSAEQKVAAAEQLARAGFVVGDLVIIRGSLPRRAGRIGRVQRLWPRVHIDTWFGPHKYGEAACTVEGIDADVLSVTHCRKLTEVERERVQAETPEVPPTTLGAATRLGFESLADSGMGPLGETRFAPPGPNEQGD